MLRSSFLQDVDLLFSNVIHGNDNYFFQPMKECEVNYPVFDQRYTEDEQQIIIAVPGASKKDIHVDLKGDILSIVRDNTDTSKDETKYIYNNHKISKKKFDIAFKIPKKWDGEKLDVKLSKGELIITIPIKEEEKETVKTFQIK